MVPLRQDRGVITAGRVVVPLECRTTQELQTLPEARSLRRDCRTVFVTSCCARSTSHLTGVLRTSAQNSVPGLDFVRGTTFVVRSAEYEALEPGPLSSSAETQF